MFSTLKLPAILAVLLSIGTDHQSGTEKSIQAPAAQKQWQFEKKPSWADEFNGEGKPAASHWSYDIGGSGWGNNEKQYYTQALKNAHVAQGYLTITAHKEQIHGMDYSSARLVTKNKFDVKYGRIEVRAKLPDGRGTWPAIWMLPTDVTYGGWVKSGEIDIMEHVGYDPNTVHFTIHTEAYNYRLKTLKTSTRLIPTASTAFHRYRLDWTPDAILGFFDDEQVFEFRNEGKGYQTWPFDKTFHLLLNVAVGGDWGGQKGIDDQVFPQKMVVDYVRYYKLKQK